MDGAFAGGGEGGDEEGLAGADVGGDHVDAAELVAVVEAYDDGAVGVAEHDLRAHVYELVHEEEAALKHLLVDEDCPFSLRGYDEHDAEQVGREAGPGMVIDREYRAVNKSLDLIMVLRRDADVVAINLHLDAEAAEGLWDDAELRHAGVTDGDVGAGHGGEADEGANFNHVREHAVLCAMQRGDALNGDAIGADAVDAAAHGIEQVAELLHVRLAGGIVDIGGAFGEDGRHDDVGGAGYGWLIKQDLMPDELFGAEVEEVLLFVVSEFDAEAFEAADVCV